MPGGTVLGCQSQMAASPPAWTARRRGWIPSLCEEEMTKIRNDSGNECAARVDRMITSVGPFCALSLDEQRPSL